VRRPHHHHGALIMVEFTLWDIARNLLLAARWTVLLSLIAFVCGGLVGLVLLAMRVSPLPWLRRVVSVYVELFQGTPLLMQLFLAFFGLPLLGVDVSPWTAATVTLTLYTSAYLVDIWRGCVEAVPRGQWAAGASLGMAFSRCADGRVSGTGGEKHGADVDHRLHRTDQDWNDDYQRGVPAVSDLWDGRADLLRDVFSTHLVCACVRETAEGGAASVNPYRAA
jgi:His/Glu/Gln/Arg/opine family amino acid ABC transporter permease subunit